jgi:hypothetical protein
VLSRELILECDRTCSASAELKEWRVGRVVFGENAERGKWFRLESLLQDIAAHQPSDPSIVPGGPQSIDGIPHLTHAAPSRRDRNQTFSSPLGASIGTSLDFEVMRHRAMRDSSHSENLDIQSTAAIRAGANDCN